MIIVLSFRFGISDRFLTCQVDKLYRDTFSLLRLSERQRDRVVAAGSLACRHSDFEGALNEKKMTRFNYRLIADKGKDMLRKKLANWCVSLFLLCIEKNCDLPPASPSIRPFSSSICRRIR